MNIQSEIPFLLFISPENISRVRSERAGELVTAEKFDNKQKTPEELYLSSPDNWIVSGWKH